MDISRRSFAQRSLLATAGAILPAAVLTPAQAIEPLKRNRKPHMKLSLAAYSYRKYLQAKPEPTMTMEGFLEECAKFGLGASEPTSYYFPNDADEAYFLKFKHKAFMLGLDISGTAIGNTFTSGPGEQREKNLALTKRWIDNAAIFGAPCIRIFAGRTPNGMTDEQARKNCVETIEEACDYAGKKGVFLALENHGGVVSDAKGTLAIIREVQSNWFGVNLDTGNFHTDDPYKDIEAVAPYAINVQVKVEMSDSNRNPIKPDFERIIGILAEANYSGYVALEYEAREEPKEAVPHYLERLQTIIDKI